MKSQFKNFKVQSLIGNCLPADRQAGKLEIGNSKSGFTLLFAVLVGTLLFALGIAISNIALKEIILSTAGKASEGAFYAADTGSECALYYDLVVSKSVPTFPNSSSAPKGSSIRCGGQDIALTGTNFEYPSAGLPQTAATTTFDLSLSNSTLYPACVEVKVGKTAPQGQVAGHTVIESRGRNDSDCTNTSDNPGRVERALRVRY